MLSLDQLDLPGLMRRCGCEPDPWQMEVLTSKRPRLLLNCCRQAGKSTVVALLALLESLCTPMSTVLLLSRSLRQAGNLFRTVNSMHRMFGQVNLAKVSSTELHLNNFSRVVCLPCREDTIRGYANVRLLVIDEAARVPDELYRAVRPMLAVSQGRLVCLSTPYGKRGFFWREWSHGGEDWQRFEVPATQCPRIKPEFLEAERRSLGEACYRQEYLCSFEAQEGLVFPELRKCVVDKLPAGYPDAPPGVVSDGVGRPAPSAGDAPPGARLPSPGTPGEGSGVRVTAADVHAERYGTPLVRPRFHDRWHGGIDFGFRNPFAALWGYVDQDDVLWLVGEHYAAQQPLSYHAAKLPRYGDLIWYADPAGASDIAELRRGGFVVRRGGNAIRPGIQMVTARIHTGRLKILKGRCPNLLREADLYRYSAATDETVSEEYYEGAAGSENPIDSHNHALAALRYLVSRLDQNRQVLDPLAASDGAANLPNQSA